MTERELKEGMSSNSERRVEEKPDVGTGKAKEEWGIG